MKEKKMKKLQKGRSMLEMLAVLFIVGILSIGGLEGYSFAVSRLKANALTEYVTSCIVTAQAQKPNLFGRNSESFTLDCNEDVLKRPYPNALSHNGEITIYDYDVKKDKVYVYASGVSKKVADSIADRFTASTDPKAVQPFVAFNVSCHENTGCEIRFSVSRFKNN